MNNVSATRILLVVVAVLVGIVVATIAAALPHTSWAGRVRAAAAAFALTIPTVLALLAATGALDLT
ncbi:hypothetical protein [Catenuloplanes indicus]|uniref:Uncharacterized protein n=1 Tax=Catenuloplanes indicus TaxID=137267 RepID=A0AAE4B1D3_9ACTN|nr:hypothetical protein [Catenuloplanes indicus]MDQ0369526.1 hypothetical protein [Catenuloplanes indicus]